MYIHLLPPEKIVPQRASEVIPYASLRLAKTRAATPAPRKAAVDPVSGMAVEPVPGVPDVDVVP